VGADENIKTIQAVYEAFGRGDVGAVLDHVTDDVDWATETSSTVAPLVRRTQRQRRRGRFLRRLRFDYGSPGVQPVCLRRERHDSAHRRALSGHGPPYRQVDNDLHHFFRFHDGKISCYRGTEDTAQTEDALKS